MEITIKPVKIKDSEANEVTSSKIFKSKKIKDNDRYLFHEDGIFSEKIFGRFGRCYCGARTKVGYCDKCDCRVISRKSMPNFYMQFDFDLPTLHINYNKNQDTKLLHDLITYKGFLYDGEYVDFDSLTIDKYDIEKITYGKEAILSLGVSEEWYKKNTKTKIAIPHTSYRQIIFQNNNYFLGNLNIIYLDLLKQKEKYNRLISKSTLTKIADLNLRHLVYNKIEELYDELFGILATNRHNLMHKELRGHTQTGMVRGVITNNSSLDEDTLKIGYYFLPMLYPDLLEEYTDDEGTDIEAINQKLLDDEYLVLFNRQPTIGVKSIISMIPQFSYEDDEMFVIQVNPIVFDGLAADVDGDSLNIIALYSKEANEEAKKLLASHNYIEGSNSTIRNTIIEDFAYAENN